MKEYVRERGSRDAVYGLGLDWRSHLLHFTCKLLYVGNYWLFKSPCLAGISGI